MWFFIMSDAIFAAAIVVVVGLGFLWGQIAFRLGDGWTIGQCLRRDWRLLVLEATPFCLAAIFIIRNPVTPTPPGAFGMGIERAINSVLIIDRCKWIEAERMREPEAER